MNIKTESIIDTIEVILNKSIKEVTKDDLNNITYLNISRIGFDDILNVDSSDLLIFKNLSELSIEGCIIDNKFIKDVMSLKKIKKISFIKCDFIDDSNELLKSLEIEELVINNVNGLNNITISDLNKLTFINTTLNCTIKNVKTLDISRSINTNINIEDSNINELIIKEKQLNSKYINLKSKITIIDDYNEVIKVINNDD